MIQSSSSPSLLARWMIWVGVILHVVVGFSRHALHPLPEKPLDHYAYLTAGVLKGQTHLDVEPPAGLARLENPYLGFQGVEKLHDATYFNGKYYLYFGITPVLLLFAPWRVLTGTYLPDAYATLVFCTLAFWFLAETWRKIRSHWFPDLSWRWDLVGILALSIGSFTPTFVQQSVIYTVPITCAGFCGSVALWSVTQLLAGTRWTKSYLFLAGTAWALCMGARPSYLFSFVGLGLLLLWVGCSSARAQSRSARVKELLSAAIPVFVIGVGLAWYNYARFGSVTEFGVHYQLASSDQRNLVLMSVDYLADRFVDYFLAAPEVLTTYPFLVQSATWGLLFWTPFALLGLAAPVLCWRPRTDGAPHWPWLVWVVTPFGLLNLFCVMLVAFANDRYSFDFLPFLNLTALVVCASLGRTLTGLSRRAFLGAAGLLLSWSLLAGVIMGLQSANVETRAVGLVRALNQPSSWLETWLGIKHGPVALEVRFPTRAEGKTETLFSTGEGRDRLQVTFLPAQRARLTFLPFQGVPIHAEPFTFDPQHIYRFELDWGSLYPSKDHTYFKGADESRVRDLKSRLRVIVDGQAVIDRRREFSPSMSLRARVGHFEEKTSGAASGLIRKIAGGICLANSAPYAPSSGDMSLHLRLPRFTSYYSVPLLASGRAGKADLFWLTYVSEGKATLSHHSLKYGVATSETFAYTADAITVIQFQIGGFANASTGLLEGFEGLKIRVNGEEVLVRRRHFYAAKPEEFYFGHDPFTLGLTSPNLDAELVAVQAQPHFDSRSIVVERKVEGPVRLHVQLPEIPSAGREPLFSVGTSGDADLFFVEPVGGGLVRFGVEVWGYGTVLSDPLRLQSGPIYTLDVSLGSLYPPLRDPRWPANADQERLKRKILVRVNDALLWETELPGVRDRTPSITLASNDLGFSGCALSFAGKVRLKDSAGPSPFVGPEPQMAPFQLAVQFPEPAPRAAEPLFIQGVTGNADILYVKYLPNNQIVLGLDQWGVSASESEPIAIDPSHPYIMTVLTGPLLPPSENGFWLQPQFTGKENLRRSFWVALDGKIVWRCPAYQPTTRPRAFSFGVNAIQASTCVPEFSGHLQLATGKIQILDTE